MASKPKLEPCRFCGGEAVICGSEAIMCALSVNEDILGYQVCCTNKKCGVSTRMFPTPEAAAAAWNRRTAATPSNAAAIREAYEFAEEFLRDYGTDWKLHNKLCDMLKSALAAPARNCDVPHKDDHELWLRWQAFCAEIYPSRMSFSTWLLDLAQEGGAK